MIKLKTAKIALITGITLMLALSAGDRLVSSAAGIAAAQDDWKGKFDSICARTQDP